MASSPDEVLERLRKRARCRKKTTETIEWQAANLIEALLKMLIERDAKESALKQAWAAVPDKEKTRAIGRVVEGMTDARPRR